MFDPQQALMDLLQPGGPAQTLFPPSSRYHGLALGTWTAPDGTIRVYLRRRVLPPLGARGTARHVVAAGERLDHLAFRLFGDPEQFWRIADVNPEMRAEPLVSRLGRVIALPADVAIDRT